MLTLIALSALLMQEPPAPPARPEIRTRMIAGPHGPGSLDKDGDGLVSREEFAAPMNEHFARMDKDGDGRLSAGELPAGHGPGEEGRATFHRGPDGAPGAHRFEMGHPHPAGAAGSGAHGEREIVVHGPGGHGMPLMIHGPGHHGPGGESVEIRHMGGPGHHATMDKDGDGRISEAEFTGPLREAFTRMDADRSGFIEEAERGRGHDVQVLTRRIETRDGED